MNFPPLSEVSKLQGKTTRLFIGAYGFEDRSLGWVNFQQEQGAILQRAIVFRYKRPKGRNRIGELRKSLLKIGVSKPQDINYDSYMPHDLETIFPNQLETFTRDIEEIIVDISAMTKLLILISLYQLNNYMGTVRIIYSEPENYCPTQKEYEMSRKDASIIAKFPSRGFESIIRIKCLSSIRMQGQPVSLVAFTSFNEQLVRHMLGTINPHRLLFINGRPPRSDYEWRERATQEIHSKLEEEYRIDNPVNKEGQLIRVASTLDYRDTISCIDEIYNQFGIYERIICAATGSKMQTVGLSFSKIKHPDIHIEYPTPDSYFVKGISQGVRNVYEVIIPRFSEFLRNIRISSS